MKWRRWESSRWTIKRLRTSVWTFRFFFFFKQSRWTIQSCSITTSIEDDEQVYGRHAILELIRCRWKAAHPAWHMARCAEDQDNDFDLAENELSTCLISNLNQLIAVQMWRIVHCTMIHKSLSDWHSMQQHANLDRIDSGRWTPLQTSLRWSMGILSRWQWKWKSIVSHRRVATSRCFRGFSLFYLFDRLFARAKKRREEWIWRKKI